MYLRKCHASRTSMYCTVFSQDHLFTPPNIGLECRREKGQGSGSVEGGVKMGSRKRTSPIRRRKWLQNDPEPWIKSPILNLKKKRKTKETVQSIPWLKKSSGCRLESWEGLLFAADVSTTCAEASAQVVERSVANSASLDSNHHRWSFTIKVYYSWVQTISLFSVILFETLSQSAWWSNAAVFCLFGTINKFQLVRELPLISSLFIYLLLLFSLFFLGGSHFNNHDNTNVISDILNII